MRRPWRVVALPYLWLAVFFALPVLMVAKLSLSHTVLAMPPYAPQLDWSKGHAGVRAFVHALSFDTYARLTADRLYLHAHDLKGLGGTYQFPLVTRVAGSLSKLLAEPDTRAHAPLNLVDAHIQAIRAIVRDDIRAADHPVGVALCQTLEESVRHHMPTDDSGSSTRP